MNAQIDTAALLAYLSGKVSGLGHDIALTQIAGGQSNPTFFLDSGTRRLVLRKRPAGDLLPSAHAVDREFRVQAALCDTDVAVPEMVHFCEDEEVIGTQFYLMERVEGRVLHDNSLREIPPEERRAYFEALARMLAAIHSIDVATVGLEDFGKKGGFAARQIARWTRQWELSRSGDNAAIDRLVKWLPENLPSEDRTTLVHGDFRLGNVMFHPAEPRIVAVLDWELSTLGHPLADLAHTCIYTWYMRGNEYGRGLLDADREVESLPAMDEFTRVYSETVGCSEPLTRFYLALALFRNAVIFEGIASRARQGNAASRDAAQVGKLAPALAARGAALIAD
jgi:aminoglycoside phosphotransferase (APT) family kinase protein